MTVVCNFYFSIFLRLTWEFLGLESEREDSVCWPNNKIIDWSTTICYDLVDEVVVEGHPFLVDSSAQGASCSSNAKKKHVVTHNSKRRNLVIQMELIVCSRLVISTTIQYVLTWQDPGPGNWEPEGIHVHVLEELHVLLQIGQIPFTNH